MQSTVQLSAYKAATRAQHMAGAVQSWLSTGMLGAALKHTPDAGLHPEGVMADKRTRLELIPVTKSGTHARLAFQRRAKQAVDFAGRERKTMRLADAHEHGEVKVDGLGWKAFCKCGWVGGGYLTSNNAWLALIRHLNGSHSENAVKKLFKAIMDAFDELPKEQRAKVLRELRAKKT